MTKIQLSAEEMQLVNNSEWILTKQRIIDKVYIMFGGMSAVMQEHLQAMPGILHDEVLKASPKISKGEQYESMPWVVLDYPRVFSKHNVLAVRSFFWWGNYFTITLHLKGKFLEAWKEKHPKGVLDDETLYVSVSGNEFNFNLHNGDYSLPVDNTNITRATLPFLKLSYKVPFANWGEADEILLQHFKQLTNWLCS